MSLYAHILEAQREREVARELGAAEPQRCKSPMCDQVLRPNNTTGFCKVCQQWYPGRRWYLLSLPKWVGNRRKYLAAVRADCNRRGICPVCTKRPKVGSRCAECTELQRQYAARRRSIKKKSGQCLQCRLLSGDRWLCAKHRAKAALRSRRYKERKRLEADRQRVRELLARIPGAA